MSREIHLDGGEITVLKAIGFGGTHVSGEQLIEKMPEFEEAELLDTIQGLIMMGYVVADKQSLHNIDDVKRSTFNINSGYSRDLREAIDPNKKPEKKSRRVRRE